jgi:hypothetical protein
MRALALTAFGTALLAHPVAAQSNVGAIPAYQAIANAKAEVASDPGMNSVTWGDAGIRPLAHGWCVILHGYDIGGGGTKRIPVFVEQNGRAWRTDAYGNRKYDGGADGLYMPPIVATRCRASQH